MPLTNAEKQARFRARHRKPRQSVPQEAVAVTAVPPETERKVPLAYMLDIMNDGTVDPARRDRMAIAAAPFCHPRLSEPVGKKDARRAAAAAASAGRFAPGAPPKLVN